jgi:outer membrane protein assembly factor BamA
LELQQYVPFFNERRVIALRARSVLTASPRGQAVPFFLQPTLGGPDDLRGFAAFRFYGNNLMLLNAEYRWEVTSGLDMAVFGDAGKVFQRATVWDRGRLETSYGIGFRFNLANKVFARIDTGFGREGPQVWPRLSNVF